MLTTKEETAMVDYIEYMSSRNMPLRRSNIRVSLLAIINIPKIVLQYKPMSQTLWCAHNIY